MIVSGLIREASTRLVDQEEGYQFTTWKEPDLLAAVNWAISAVSDVRPDIFASWHRVDIPPGATATITAPCEEVLEVGGLYDPNGQPIKNLNIIDRMSSLVQRKEFCQPDPDAPWDPPGVELLSNRSLRFFPPAPPGYTMDVYCTSTPVATDVDFDLNIPTKWRAPLAELIMYYALMFDQEAVPNRDRANRHWESAMQLLGGTRGQS